MTAKHVVRITTITVGFILVWFFLAAPLWLDADDGAVPPVDLALPEPWGYHRPRSASLAALRSSGPSVDGTAGPAIHPERWS